MTSHEYARKLASLAEWLLGRPEFNATLTGPTIDFFPGDKDLFLAAVKACGSGKKRIDSGLLIFQPNTPAGTKLELNIGQHRVCTLVSPAEVVEVEQTVKVSKTMKPAEYECEPLLSQTEVEQIGS